MDEIFLHIVEWDGVEIWHNNLLETRLFDSYIAGEQVFRHLDKLLQERNPVYADLARIYLIALSLGFQGKHRNTSDTQQLDKYRQQMFKLFLNVNLKAYMKICNSMKINIFFRKPIPAQ